VIIGIAGKSGSGKSLTSEIVADLLESRGHPCRLIAFADPLKRIAEDLFQFSPAQLDGSAKDEPDERYPREAQHKFNWDADKQRWVCARCGEKDRMLNRSLDCLDCLTPRQVYQGIGQAVRVMYPPLWSEIGAKEARTWEANGPRHVAILTDVRYVQDAEAVRRAGGEVWLLTRSDPARLSEDAQLHVSEQQVQTPAFRRLVNRVIENTGSKEDLKRQIVSILDDEVYERYAD